MKNALFLILGMISALAMAQDISEEMKVRLVEIDVKVTDWAGEFIPGLQQNEFSIFENGQAMKIDSFREVVASELTEDEKQAYQPRVMLVLDLKNTSYSRMKRAFPALKEYAANQFDNNVEMGLAVNAQGYQEVLPFTTDQEEFMKAVDTADAFYKRSMYRILRPQSTRQADPVRHISVGSAGSATNSNIDSLGGGKLPASYFVERALAAPFNPDTVSLNQPSTAHSRINSASTNSYIFSELDALNQFVNYLSAYTGKKDVLLVSQLWNAPVEEADLRGLVTTCVQHKVTLNVLGLKEGLGASDDRFKLSAGADNLGIGLRSGLAANTAGFSRTIEYRQLPTMLEEAVSSTQRYYRLRFYSDLADESYRKLKVKVPGIKRQVVSFSGFDPRPREISNDTVDAAVAASALEEADLNLSLDTDWMTWEWSSIGRRQTYYAVGQRAYDETGRVIGEKVNAGQLIQRKYDGEFEKVRLEKDYELNIPENVKISKLAFIVVDLSTGKKVEVDKI